MRSAASRSVDRTVYGIRIARVEEREPRFLTWDEVLELQSWIPEYVSRIAPLAVLTMLRRGEILGLRDADVDLSIGSIAAFAQRQDGERVQTKTRAGRRTVDIGPVAVNLLREQQLARTPTAEGYLFPAPSGVAFDGDNFMSRVFKPAARHAGMPELSFHDLRHTGASLMIAAGCHVKVIADRMGPSDGGTLVRRRYGHLYKGAGRQAAIALESQVSGHLPCRRSRRVPVKSRTDVRSNGLVYETPRGRGGTREPPRVGELPLACGVRRRRLYDRHLF